LRIRLPSWQNRPERNAKPAKARLCRAFVFPSGLSLSLLYRFDARCVSRLCGDEHGAGAAAPTNADKQRLCSPKITAANTHVPGREGYPRSMSKKKRGCLATYRQSEGELFENSFRVGSNVNNL
jgi:hypothetical protein